MKKMNGFSLSVVLVIMLCCFSAFAQSGHERCRGLQKQSDTNETLEAQRADHNGDAQRVYKLERVSEIQIILSKEDDTQEVSEYFGGKNKPYCRSNNGDAQRPPKK